MKKAIFISFIILSLFGCKKTISENNSTIPADSLLIHILDAFADTSKCAFDVKDEFYMFADTMIAHAQYHPDGQVRAEAKASALYFSNLILQEEAEVHGEEEQQFIDSIILKLAHVQTVWYYACPEIDGTECPILTQFVPRFDEHFHTYFTILDVSLDKTNGVMITFPEDAVETPFIRFGNSSLEGITDIIFDKSNAYKFYPREKDSHMSIAYGQDLIDAMLTNDIMYIGYINDQYEKSVDDRFCSCMVWLNDFHNQYPK